MIVPIENKKNMKVASGIIANKGNAITIAIIAFIPC